MPRPDLDFRNRNTLWCSVLVETLVRCGLQQAVLSPGSRCTPLTLAFARHASVESLSALDERSAAFFALGLAKQHRKAVALVCTSGTAAANYLPAIIEARESGVPLIVLTADRPPELRDCSAGQTIDQQKLYGSQVLFYHELAVPEPSLPMLRYLRQMAAQAFRRSMQPIPGPIHLNCPFRDPLHPAPEEGLEPLRPELEGDPFWAHLTGLHAERCLLSQWPLPRTQRGLIIAGPNADASKDCANTISAIARRLGWPLLADALSPIRHHSVEVPALVPFYDAILRSDVLAQQLRPEAILVLGSLPTSKVLRKWLETLAGVPVLILSELIETRDAFHGSSIQARVCTKSVMAHLPDKDQPPSPYAGDWARANQAVNAVFEQGLAPTGDPFELKAAWLLSQRLPKGTPVFVASSMPVRDVEYVWMPGDKGTQISFNRGANGIDGTLSTALGIAHGNQPSILLTGDLSLLHDSNGFLLAPILRGSLTIILINNEGGGIFEHLPVSEQKEHFETYFATPQAVCFADLARAHKVRHTLVHDWDEFAALISSLPAGGVQILELRTKRKIDASRRKNLFAEAAARAEATWRQMDT